MNKLIKIFPFLPAEKNGGKLALALVFYLVAPPIAASIVGTILLPISLIVGLAFCAYSIMGVVFSIMSFTGHDFTAEPEKKDTEETTEE